MAAGLSKFNKASGTLWSPFVTNLPSTLKTVTFWSIGALQGKLYHKSCIKAQTPLGHKISLGHKHPQVDHKQTLVDHTYPCKSISVNIQTPVCYINFHMLNIMKDLYENSAEIFSCSFFYFANSIGVRLKTGFMYILDDTLFMVLFCDGFHDPCQPMYTSARG